MKMDNVQTPRGRCISSVTERDTLSQSALMLMKLADGALGTQLHKNGKTR
jgi:hypothetical protein